MKPTRIAIELLLGGVFLLVFVPRIPAAVDWSVRAANAKSAMADQVELNRTYVLYEQMQPKGSSRHLDDAKRRPKQR